MRATTAWLRCCCSPSAQHGSSLSTRCSPLRAVKHGDPMLARGRGGVHISRSIRTLTKHNKADLEKPFQAVFHSYCLPHPAKREVGGEDSYFACHETGTCGVADGVGGW